jgi:NADH-quinone oxidoreductase subunit H
MKFGMFFLGEYTHMITTSFLMVVLFFGGWNIPGTETWLNDMGLAGVVIKVAIFAVKMSAFIIFYMMVRWTLPRFRFDQLMGLAWKVLIPLALINLLAVMVVRQYSLTPWVLLPVSLVILVVTGLCTSQMPEPPQRPGLKREPVESLAR